MPDTILILIADGGTLTVRPHDAMNPRCGYIARIELPKWTTSANGDTPAQAIAELAALLRSGVAL